MNDLWTKLNIPKIKVIEVGAAKISDNHICDNLIKQDGIEYIGFEPNKKECRLLNNCSKFKYLPLFIGDGSAEDFYETEFEASSSIFQPNIPLLSKFSNLAEAHTVKNKSRIYTHMIDGLTECKNADFLKIDCQGSELAVLRGAEYALKKISVVQTEVMFLEMYLFAPLFADLDMKLTNEGFRLHKFFDDKRKIKIKCPNCKKTTEIKIDSGTMCGMPFKPAKNKEKPHRPISQAMWTDIIYVKDFMNFEALEPEKLLKTAAIMNDCYGSTDFVHYILMKYDEQTGEKRAREYREWTRIQSN